MTNDIKSLISGIENKPFYCIIIIHIFLGNHSVMKSFRQAILFLCCLLCLTACDNNDQLQDKSPSGQNLDQASVHPSRVLKCEINGSFVNSAKSAGLTNAQIQRIASIFRGRIDFRRDLHPGDSFRVLFDKDHSDNAAKILAVSFNIDGQNINAYRSADGRFYNESSGNEGLDGRDKRQFLAKMREYKRLLLSGSVGSYNNNESDSSDSEQPPEYHGNDPIEHTNIIAKINDIFNKIKDALGSDIQIVKDSKMDFGNSTMTVREWIGALVGIRGAANWKEFVTPENIHIVQVDLSRKINRKNESARIQWMVNPDTKFVKMSAIEINSKAEQLLVGVFLLSPWAMESLAD